MTAELLFVLKFLLLRERVRVLRREQTPERSGFCLVVSDVGNDRELPKIPHCAIDPSENRELAQGQGFNWATGYRLMPFSIPLCSGFNVLEHDRFGVGFYHGTCTFISFSGV